MIRPGLHALRLLTAAVLLAGFGAAQAAWGATLTELWRFTGPRSDCRVELVNELGGVRVGASSATDPVTVVRGDAGLTIVAPAVPGRPVLSVARVEADVGVEEKLSTPADLELTVAPGCTVTVRTGEGAVALEVGRESFPATIETVTGDITAWVDPVSEAAISFATSGEITTDFTVEIDLRYHAEPAKHGTVRRGSDTEGEAQSTRVQLSSRRGAVRLLHPPADKETRMEKPDGNGSQ